MPVTSVHQEILQLTVTRLEALTSLGGMRSRVIRRAVKAGSWQTGTPAGDYVVVSGWGQMRLIGDDDNCSRNIAYPLTIAPVYRTTKQWDATDEDWQMQVTQVLLDAFIDKPLTLTYPGAENDNVIFVGGLTMQSLDESFEQIMRELVFEVWVNQMRT